MTDSIDLSVDLAPRNKVGLRLVRPVGTASGTFGWGYEYEKLIDVQRLGVIFSKATTLRPRQGNPQPRIAETPAGMLNSIGLQNPGVEAWLDQELPALAATGARVVASIWGMTVSGYEKAAAVLADAPVAVVAVEVNLSCPNVEARRDMFAHSPSATAEAIGAAGVAGLPLWAKLSPNVTDLVEIADVAQRAGAEAVTLVNTVMGMAIDPATRKPVLGNKGGGLSGAAIHPVAVRAVWDVHEALPALPIVGVGGVSAAADAVELLLAGACAVQVGTATFRDPKAPARLLRDLRRWCDDHDVARLPELIGAAHGR